MVLPDAPHHPRWDYDLSSPALLPDITVDGKAEIQAVALPSKQGYLYIFDHGDRKPIWPINEKPVTQTDVPGEKTAKTQPVPTRPANYVRTTVTMDDIVDFTPEIHAKAVDIVKKYYKLGTWYNPPVVSNPTGGFPSGAMGNGTGGTRHQLAGRWLQSGKQGGIPAGLAERIGATGLVPLPEGLSDLKYDSGTGGQVFRINGGPGFGSASDAPKVSADDPKLAAALPRPIRRSQLARPRHAMWTASRSASRPMAPSPPSTSTPAISSGRWPNGLTPDRNPGQSHSQGA